MDEKHILNTITIQQFEDQLKAFNDKGRELTLEHRKKFVKEKGKGKRITNYHAPGAKLDDKCKLCNEIVAAHNDYMQLESSVIGFTGIPFDNIMSAIKITRATIIMMKNGGELND